ncbi:hypothetical protein HMPREF1869_01677 [Bacteroidales bacterium KA00251]|nr:hypothetical protein HMPREF1869_01677 [Bacteroidales bacterium KA00251]
MFREILGNVPRVFEKCSERFWEMFREISLSLNIGNIYLHERRGF